MVIEATRACGRGAKAAQQGVLETVRGYWSLLDLVGKTGLPFARLEWLI